MLYRLDKKPVKIIFYKNKVNNHNERFRVISSMQ